MSKKLISGFAALGLLAGNVFADKVIADFSEGTATAFSDYSYGYGSGYSGNDGVGGFFSFDYDLGTDPETPILDKDGNPTFDEDDNPIYAPFPGNDDMALYQISVNDGSAALKETPDFPITECVGGFSYKYKGAAHIFITEISEDVGYDVFKTATQPKANDWTTATITPNSLSQEGWGTAQTWSLGSITILKWAINNKVTGLELEGSLSLDDITCLTDAIEPPPTEEGENSYYIFKYGSDDVTPWGDYVMAYTYNGGSVGNPEDDDGIVTRADGVAKIYDVTAGDGYWGAFIGIATENKVTGQSPGPKDCENGFSYWYKSDKAHTFIVQFPLSYCSVTGDNVYGNQWKKTGIAASSSTWTKVTYSLGDLGNSDATGCGSVDKDLSIVEQITWGFEGNPNAGGGGNLMIANVACLVDGAIADETAPSESIPYTIGDPNPILSGLLSSANFTVVSVANSLQINSVKDAKLSLFSISGKQVFNKNISAGYETVSLNNLKQGVYFAVVQSGSHKQTIKVVLK